MSQNIMGRDLQFRNIYGEWVDCESIYEYRIKPKTKIVRFRNYLDYECNIQVALRDISESCKFAQWIGDWQEIEVPIEA